MRNPARVPAESLPRFRQGVRVASLAESPVRCRAVFLLANRLCVRRGSRVAVRPGCRVECHLHFLLRRRAASRQDGLLASRRESRAVVRPAPLAASPVVFHLESPAFLPRDSRVAILAENLVAILVANLVVIRLALRARVRLVCLPDCPAPSLLWSHLAFLAVNLAVSRAASRAESLLASRAGVPVVSRHRTPHTTMRWHWR